MCLVVSAEQNEIATFAKWGIDIAPHRKKMVTRELDKEFRDADNPFRVVFVCAMWLTSFDVKPLAAMYFDKRIEAVRTIIERFGLDVAVPTDFDGLPVTNPQRWRYWDGKPDTIHHNWQLFRAAQGRRVPRATRRSARKVTS